MKKKSKIVISPLNLNRWIVQFHYNRAVSELGENCEVVLPNRTEEDVAKATLDADFIYGQVVTKKVIESAKKLKLIQTFGSGTEAIDIEAAAEKGIPVCNVKGFSFAVAEHAVALLLTLANNIMKYDCEVRKGNWESARSGLRLGVDGNVLGIIGLGAIGTEVARRMKPFNVKMIAIKKNLEEKPAEDLELEFLSDLDGLSYLMEKSDFIVVTLRATPETIGVINEEMLRKMKTTALLVNVSRGAIIDEKGLCKVLMEKRIAGAGLDVLKKEPPDLHNPLLTLDNVVLTPHVGGKTEESYEIMSREGIENIKRIMKGNRPKGEVRLSG